MEKPVALQKRLPAIDALRGIIMVLMTLDHASHVFNVGRYVTDSARWYVPGSVIPVAQFLTRWITHICAPTFIFLAGLVLAQSIARRQTGGESVASIDTFLLKRGLFILLLDPIWMSIAFREGVILQVLYAIGGSFCCMILLRRIGDRTLLAIGLALFLFGSLFVGLALQAGGGQTPGVFGALFIAGGRLSKNVYVLYPLLPWLAYMILGWVFGRHMLLRAGNHPIRLSLIGGGLSLAVFCAVRGLNQYGNMGLFRDNLSILQWLHVSKYPPSLSFAGLELGLMFLLLALLLLLYQKRSPSTANPLLVFGRTPLFFYLIHVHLLTASAYLLGMHRKGGLAETFLATIIELIMLYPLCRWYFRFKKTHSESLLRYV